MARSERFELPALGIEIRCSIQLSYERISLFNGLETHANVLAQVLPQRPCTPHGVVRIWPRTFQYPASGNGGGSDGRVQAIGGPARRVRGSEHRQIRADIQGSSGFLLEGFPGWRAFPGLAQQLSSSIARNYRPHYRRRFAVVWPRRSRIEPCSSRSACSAVSSLYWWPWLPSPYIGRAVSSRLPSGPCSFSWRSIGSGHRDLLQPFPTFINLAMIECATPIVHRQSSGETKKVPLVTSTR